jgi:hypothetical protein
MAVTQPKDPYLATLAADALAATDCARELAGELTEGQLAWSPAPGSWSMAQCLDHLAITFERWRPYLERAIARGRARGSTPSRGYRPKWLGRWFVDSVRANSRWKFQTPGIFAPPASPAAGSLGRFEAAQQGYLGLLARADGLDLNANRLRSAVTPLLWLTLGEALTAVIVHAQRHLAQARRVRERPGFPAR